MRNEARFNRIWYEGESPTGWMRILSFLFVSVTSIRRLLYRAGAFRSTHPGVPVIVIGNIVAGGAGKTPLAIALVSSLQGRGMRVGVITRGYGGKPGKKPVLVGSTTSVKQVGDEARLLADRTGAPVCAHPRRVRAAETLLAASPVDILLCDDGLQHYALARDLEIVVVDGNRGLGNRKMLPAGPLREGSGRLHEVDYVVINGCLSDAAAATLPLEVASSAVEMILDPVALVNVKTGERRAADALTGTRCVAIAGIGNPQRFFETLGALGYTATCRAFPDHHAYTFTDLEFAGDTTVLMTEKDAVKCREFARDTWWYLEAAAVPGTNFIEKLVERINEIRGSRQAEKSE